MNSIRHTILGLFFFVTLAVLGFVTIYLGGWHPLEHPVTYVAYTADADNIGAGDPVLVFGKQAGRVNEVVFTEGTPPPERRLRVTFTLDNPVKLFDDYSMVIGSQSLLGGKQLNIDTGTKGPLAEAAYNDLHATSEGNVLRSLGRVLGQNEGDLHRIMSSVADITEGLKTGQRNLAGLFFDKKAYEDVTSGIASARSILDKADHGEGSVAKAINSPELHDSAKGFLDDGRTIFRDAKEKDGPIHALIYDEEMAAKLRRGIDGLSAVAERTGKGEGLLGKLTSAESDATWNDMKQIASDARVLIADTRAGKGAVGKLFVDPEVEQSVVTITKHFATIAVDAAKLVDDARRGRGVVGWLFADDEARRTIERLANQLARAVEDAREAAPVSSVASFLFGQL